MLPRDLDKIDDLMQDITEQQDIAQEISEAFSQRVQFADGFDEVGSPLKECGRGCQGGRPPITQGRQLACCSTDK